MRLCWRANVENAKCQKTGKDGDPLIVASYPTALVSGLWSPHERTFRNASKDTLADPTCTTWQIEVKHISYLYL